MVNRKIFYLISFLFSVMVFLSSSAKAQDEDVLMEVKAKTHGIEILFRFYKDLPKSYFNMIGKTMDSLDTEVVKKIHDTHTVILFATNEQDFKTMFYEDETPRTVRVIKINLKTYPRWDAIMAAITDAVNKMN